MTETVRIDLHKDQLQQLVTDGHIDVSDFEVVRVDVKDFDYSQHAEWVEQKRVSGKEYKKLKNLEYEIRSKNK